MPRVAKWMKRAKLTKAEIAHVWEVTTGDSWESFKRNREFHRTMKASDKDGREPCFVCRHIAIKAKLEEL